MSSDTKTRFGLYFIPDSGPLYDAGSRLVGYDIRAQAAVDTPDFVDPAWTKTAAPYGFHVTITDAIDIETVRLPEVIERVKALLACFYRTNTYQFSKKSVGFSPEGGDQVIMRLKPNRQIEMLHDVLSTAILPLGAGSAYTLAGGGDILREPLSDEQRAKLKLFHAPYLFDEFEPHFTCIKPFRGSTEQREQVAQKAAALFAGITTIDMHKLALVVRPENETCYRILTEFDLN